MMMMMILMMMHGGVGRSGACTAVCLQSEVLACTSCNGARAYIRREVITEAADQRSRSGDLRRCCSNGSDSRNLMSRAACSLWTRGDVQYSFTDARTCPGMCFLVWFYFLIELLCLLA